MVGGSFEQALTVTLEALKRTGLRAILSAGWGSLGGIYLPDTVYQAEYIPHSWLFQHVSAAVHHGGAGTTASSLRAGLPTIVVPFGGDQPFWGECVYRLGVGPKAIPRKKLNINNFTAALTQAVSDDMMIRKAAALGEKLHGEDGVANAIQIIEKLT
jgi:UDP:flavonoid glycosyltransferase YjiC (YdhE family)